MTEIDKRALGYLGFAARARSLTIGVPLTLDAMKKGGGGKAPIVVIEAADTSANTHKRVSDRVLYYGVFHRQLEVTGEELAVAIGKRGSTVGAVGVTDPHLAAALMALWQAQEEKRD